MSDRVSTLTAILVDGVSGPAKKIQGEITNIGQTVTTVGTILQGIGLGIGERLFDVVSAGVSKLTEVIPGLIENGNAYLELIKDIQLETGGTAEEVSALTGTFRALGLPLDEIQNILARFSSNLANNEDVFARLGIATRNSNGELLSFNTILTNVRHAVQAHGESLSTTAVVQELFGKSGHEILEALQATDEEFANATDNVRRWGGIVSREAVEGADRFNASLASLTQGLTDIGVNIAAAVDPYLRAFIDSFSAFIQSHLNEIVQFAVTVVSVITGFISGIFGITDALSVTADGASKSTDKAAKSTDDWAKALQKTTTGSDAFTASIKAQIRAIDDHIHALELAAERRRAAAERVRLTESLAAAQEQLADLRGHAPFTEGLTSAEGVLARQKHAQDIIDAEKDVRDKRQALGDFEADQKDSAERELLNRQKQRLQDLLADRKATDAASLASFKSGLKGMEDASKTVLGNIGIETKEFGKNAAGSFQTGIDAAKEFLRILTGSEQVLPNGSTVRTGGVLGALGSVADAMGDIVQAIWGSDGILQPLRDLYKAFDDMGKQLDFIVDATQDAGLAIHNFIVDHVLGPLGVPVAPTDGRTSGGPFGGSVGTNLGLDLGKAISEILGLVPHKATGGWVGLRGPQLAVVGESGPEYVVPNHQLGAMGGGKTTYVTFQSVWPPTAQQAREVRDWIDEQLDIVADNVPVGLVGYRAQG